MQAFSVTLKPGNRKPDSGNGNPESGIRNPESGIRNPVSDFRFPDSGFQVLGLPVGISSRSSRFAVSLSQEKWAGRGRERTERKNTPARERL